MRSRCLACLSALLLSTLFLSVPRAVSQASAPSSPRRATSTPYSGDLSIFETPGRDQRLHIDQVMSILDIGPGKTVADIGAGSGWFTVRAARRVTNTGKVYAVDINQQAIDYIRDRARKEQLHNVATILNKPNNPGLPPDSVDAVLFLKAYHEIADPVTFLRNLRGSLRPGARVGIIERDGNGEDHGVHKEVILHEADEAGYRLVEEHDDLVKGDKMDYFLVLGLK
jgi:cyclopropane fatty-acyl-phospholipid synthase-like methyltransferase